jgi:4-hydroxysphinganine ceramide fatty acyl 2-hydroxylase
MHYALHHTQLPAYLREQKRYHLAHHYKNFELGFGVTSECDFPVFPFDERTRTEQLDCAGKFWDYVFNTQLSLRPL